MPTNRSPRAGVALLIGISDYRHPDRVAPLRYAHRDARALGRLLADPDVGGFPEQAVHIVTNRHACRERLVRRLSRWLPEKARGAEVVLLYFAGHGVVQTIGEKEEGFLVPHDADPHDLPTAGIAMSDVARWIQDVEAGGVVVCLDCCHAGKVLARGAPPPGSGARDLQLTPKALQGIAGKGRFLIASCDEGQKSLECDQLRHGLFTYHLLRGVAGAADQDGDGRVSVQELFRYVSAAVARDAREKFRWDQNPWTSAVWTEDVYVSRPGPDGSSLAGLASLDRLKRQQGAEAVVRRVEEEIATAGEQRLAVLMRYLRRLADPAGIPSVFRCLAHPAEAVREQAQKAFQAIGRENAAAWIEDLARREDAERMGAVLDGLAAFESHAYIVALLDRLVVLLKGELRKRAILLWEKKRLGVECDEVAKLFREIHSPYRIEGVLGAGLFTADYYAREELAGHPVVVSVLRPELAGQPQVRTRFLDLHGQAARFVHQNLVLTREVRAFPERNTYFTVSDYIAGPSLRRVLESGKRFEPLQMLAILRQGASALTPFHQAGLCHGGVKPSGIILGPNDHVYLGAPSLPATVVPGDIPRLSYDYCYLPPETFRSGDLGPRSDFYALGCVAFELFCGQPPFVSDTPYELVIRHDRDPVPRVSERTLRDALVAWAPAFDAFLLGLLAKSPEGRFGDLEELFAALGRLEEALRQPAPTVEDDGAPPPGPTEPLAGEQAPAPPLMHDASLARFTGGESLVPIDRPKITDTFVGSSVGGAVGDDSTGGLVPPSAEGGRLPPLGGGYVLVGRLGSGQFGEVFRARAPGGVEVAVKRIFRTLDSETGRREQAALERTKSLRHPYLLQVHAYWADENGLYIVMELADDSLNDWLRECQQAGQPGIPADQLLTYFLEAAEGLDFLHANNLLHRDVKPANLLRLRGHAKVADFGLARMQEDRLTDATFAGTPVYMPPELWRGQASIHSDQYSLALTYIELCTGKRPFTGRDQFELGRQHLMGEPDLPDFNPAERRVLRQALAKDPAKRFPTCRAFVQALAEAHAGLPAPEATPRSRRSALVAGLCAVIALLLGVLAYLWIAGP